MPNCCDGPKCLESRIHTFWKESDLTRFAARIKGDWWQQIIPHPTLYVSHVVIEADPISGQIGMSAKAYDADGNVAATWHSEAAVLIGNKLFYIWSGRYTDKKRSAEQRTGFGSFNFRGEGEAKFGQGEFLDVDRVLQKLETSKWSLAEFKRCEADESAVLNSHDTERIRELIQKKKTTTLSGGC